MPNNDSAAKRLRQTKKKTARNVSVRSETKTAVKKVVAAIEKNDKELAVKLLPNANKALAVAARKGVIHPNNAARRISRLAKATNKLGQ